MPLHQYLRNLGILERRNLKDAPYALDFPESRLPRLGGSCLVYRIKNPDFAGQDHELPASLIMDQPTGAEIDPEYNGIHEYVACKKMTLDEDWKVLADKNEISALKEPSSKFDTPPSEYDSGAYRIRHKDIKPGNILLWSYLSKPPQHAGPDDEVMPIFIDFGMSKIHDPAAIASYHAGSKLYRAPEQNPRQPNPEAPSMKSDIWSLGCCFTFIEAFMHSDRAGVKKIYDLTIKRDVDFRYYIDEINDYLASHQTAQLPENLETTRRKFRRLVQTGMKSPFTSLTKVKEPKAVIISLERHRATINWKIESANAFFWSWTRRD